MKWTKKDLLGIRELSKEEILFILETADSFKEISRRDIKKVPTLPWKNRNHLILRALNEDADIV